MSIKHTILIVDDEKSNVKFIVNNLKGSYDTKIAPNGEIALKILKKFHIDLVLLDIQMPVLDGYETIKKIKAQEKFKDIPVIFLTSQKDSHSLIRGFELGAKDYITKPFNTKELEVRVANHIQTFELIKKLEDAFKNLEKFIDTQENIAILTDGKELKFANKKCFDFLGFEDLSEFLKYYKCICEHFVENDRYFHLGKVEEDESWVEILESLPEPQRIVSMVGKDHVPHIFSVSVSQYDEDIKIVSFANITQTMIEHINLESKTIHDKLTGAYNREYFEQSYEKLLQKSKEEGSHLALAMLDIDHFKLVNDNYGHDIGDEVLKEFVNTIHRFSREEDILIRWGGEEFLLLLKVNLKKDLQKALEHLRKVIEAKDFPIVGRKTCSFGGTIYQSGEEIKATIKRADEAVYEAKRAGRNKVIIH